MYSEKETNHINELIKPFELIIDIAEKQIQHYLINDNLSATDNKVVSRQELIGWAKEEINKLEN